MKAEKIRLLLAHSKEDILDGLQIPDGLNLEYVPAWPEYTRPFRFICDKSLYLRKYALGDLPTVCPNCGDALFLNIGRRPDMAGCFIINVSLSHFDTLRLAYPLIVHSV